MNGDLLIGANGLTDVDLTEGLVAHYLLNNNADDSYGVYDGTPIGGVDFQGDVASFDGVDDYAHISAWDASRQYTQVTVSSWYRPSTIGNVDIDVIYSHLIYYGVSGSLNNSGFRLSLETDGHFSITYLVQNDEIVSNDDGYESAFYYVVNKCLSITAVAGQLYHVACVIDVNSSKLYIDGVLVCTITTIQNFRYTSDLTGRPSITIGNTYFQDTLTSYSEADGNISNLRVYDSAKNQDFITALHEEGYYPKPLPLPTIDGLIAHYLLTGTAEDTTGNYDGTQYNGVSFTDDTEIGSVAIFSSVVDADYIGAPKVPTGIGDFTVTGWVKKSDATSGWIVNNRSADTGVQNEWQLYFHDTLSELTFTLRSAEDIAYSVTFIGIPLTAHTEWYFFTAKVEGTTITASVNGVVVATTEFIGTRNNGATSTVIGTGGWSPPIPSITYDGVLSGIRIYNVALTPTETTDIYNYEKNFRPIDIDDGLIAYYPLANNSLDNYYNQADGVDYNMNYDGQSGLFVDTNSSTSSWIDTGIDRTAQAHRQTISLWSKIDGTTSSYVYGHGYTYSIRCYQDATIAVIIFGTLGGKVVDIRTVADANLINSWVHIYVHFTERTAELWINGVFYVYDDGSGGVDTEFDAQGTSNCLIGRQSHSSLWLTAHGEIAKTRMYADKLTNEQIEVIYNTEKGDFI